MAVVELNNEDALWQQYRQGAMDALSEPYATTFKNLWNEWLLHRYGTSEKLQAAWQIANVPFGEERIPEGRFDDDRRVDGQYAEHEVVHGIPEGAYL